MPQAAHKTGETRAGAAPKALPAHADAGLEAQKKSFLRMVSHELRTPLNSILGFSEILTSELYGPMGAPQYKDYAQIIRGSGLKLLKLVNQVLEIARLESGVDVSIGAEPLDAAIDDALAPLQAEISERKLSVTVTGPVERLTALADAKGLRNILGNLLQNAVTFSPDGGEVRLRARRDGAELEVVIEDDGQGVDPEELPRLLKPFEQGENALTRHGEGSGLGLAIVDLTCGALGGKLALDCTPGEGLRATVRLRAV